MLPTPSKSPWFEQGSSFISLEDIMVGVQFTPHQRAFMVLRFAETHSAVQVQQEFRRRFGRAPPTPVTIRNNFKKTRRSYLSVSFACSCLINASLFYFFRWCVNTRQESLIFKQNVTPKTNSYKYCLFVHFPVLWSSISSSTRDALLILNKSTFQSRLKTYFMENDV